MVIVIIGLLAGYVAPRYFSQVGKSEIQVARAQIDSLEKALDQYRLDNRRYPTAEEGLAALRAVPEEGGAERPVGPAVRLPHPRPARASSSSSPTAATASPAARGEDADIGLVSNAEVSLSK